MTYLSLRPGARFVRGPRRAALYDLTRRRLHPLDEWTSRLVGESLEGGPVESVLDRLGLRAKRVRGIVLEALLDHPLLAATDRPAAARSADTRPALRLAEDRPAAPAPSPGAPPLVTPSGRLAMAPAAASPAARAGGQRLDFLWLELTERCNLRCVHCYAGSGPALRDGPMEAQDHLRVLREAARAGCRSVQFTGGEATLHPSFSALVEEAKQLGFERIEVYTNATLLNEERIRFLKERGVRAAVSFYSHREEAHEAITQVPGSFRRTVESIRRLVQAGVPVRAGLIRMRTNQNDMEGARGLLGELGVPLGAITVDEVRPTGRGCGDSLVPAGERPRMTAPPSGEDLRLRADGEMGCSTCWSGKVAIAPTGDVFPCIFSRELPAGNVLQGPLSDVIQSQTLQELWSIDKAQIPVCRDCEYRYGCFDCRALAYKLTGELRSKPPSCAYDPYTGTWEGEAGRPLEPLPAATAIPVPLHDLRCAVAGGLGVLYSKARLALVSVNRVAAEVCRLCDGRRSLKGIAQLLSSRYGVPARRVSRDVRSLVRDLAALGLLKLEMGRPGSL